jgi:hypothetical protein
LQSSAALSFTKYQVPNRKLCFQQYLYCWLRIRCRGNMFTEPLPSKEHLLWLQYPGLQVSCHNTNAFPHPRDFRYGAHQLWTSFAC